MDENGVRWTAEQVLALAPDEASRRAGRMLAVPGPWTETGTGAEAVWGLCRGSGSRPYRTVVDLGGSGGPAYTCSCPSRKFPCKHAIGLLLLWSGAAEGSRGQPGFAGAQVPPEWAGEWLTERRVRATARAARPVARTEGGLLTPGDGGSRTEDRSATEGRTEGRSEEGTAPGPGTAGARQRAEARERRIAAGAAELEERLADLLRGGLAGADQQGYTAWEETAARMVDAQAPGLAARARELGALPYSGSGWPGRMLAECALLHMLDEGFMAVDRLPAPLAATVRARVGRTITSAEVLAGGQGAGPVGGAGGNPVDGAGGSAPRVRDEWLVLGGCDRAEGRLTARRTWLRGRATGRDALLLSYAPSGHPHELDLVVGSFLYAEVAYHPGAAPLRIALGERHAPPRPGPVPAGGTLTDALAAYAVALCGDPWLEGWPAVLRDVVPVPGGSSGEGWQITGPADGTGSGSERASEELAALPVAAGTPSTALWKLTAISGGGPVTLFGECGHRGFAPHTVWDGEAAVPL